MIGGGDWAPDRIVVDFVQAITAKRPLILRNPDATRPWQHVLEPLSGYLHLTQKLLEDDGLAFASGWNFGPGEENVHRVEDLARGLVAAWGVGEVVIERNAGNPHEASLLKLDCSMARSQLGWHGVWDFIETLRYTVDWYRSHSMSQNVSILTLEQIKSYQTAARHTGLPWTQ